MCCHIGSDNTEMTSLRVAKIIDHRPFNNWYYDALLTQCQSALLALACPHPSPHHPQRDND